MAIYARVSTKDKQDVANQLHELRAYCKRMGFEIYHEYIDNESGSKGRKERQRISERTRPGLETARKNGKTLGRPTKEHITDEITKLVAKGWSKSRISKKLKVDIKTVRKYNP